MAFRRQRRLMSEPAVSVRDYNSYKKSTPNNVSSPNEHHIPDSNPMKLDQVFNCLHSMNSEMSTTENYEVQESEAQHVPELDIKNEECDLTIHIKPENYEDINTANDDDDNPFQNIQVEIKQEELQQTNKHFESNMKMEIIPKHIKELCHISETKTDEFDIKSEIESSEMVVPDDYPSQDEGSMDSNEARALHNVEACLQDDIDGKVGDYQVHNNAIDNVKDEMGYMVTETHLISNKLINTTSTVTIPCEGMIESETTKTLIMEIHPMLHTATTLHKIGTPEVILPTAYHETGYDDFQLNSITSNILPLEQEAYGLLQAKKKKCLNRPTQYACPKCTKLCNTPYTLKKHLSVHDSIERRALGVVKGLQTRIERKSKNYYDKVSKVKEKQKEQKNKITTQQIRRDRLEKRLQRIKRSERKKSNSVKTTNTPQDNIKIEIEVKGVKNENIKKEGYVCTCGQVFQRKSRMETCLRSHETYTDSNCYACMSCSKQFKDKVELASHRKRLHRKRFPCKFCPTDYNTRKELFKHLQIHQEVQLTEYKVISQVVMGKQKLKCFMCRKAYSELSDLKSHVMEDHKQPYICSHCKGTFSKIIDFCNHTKTRHPEVEGQPVLDVLEAFSKLVKAWKCEECELQFHEADKLAKHQVEQHSPEIKTEAQFQCQDCHRMFVSQKGLTSHARIHHNIEHNEDLETAEQGVMCVECRKICKDMDALTSHMRLHSPERKYPCKFCDFRFTTPEKRKAHSEIHTGDMKYVCFICEYQCSSENRLQQHKISLKHANMKEFLLTGKPLIQEDPPTSSKKQSSSKDTEAKKRKKEKDNLSSEDEEELMCDVCGDKFSSKKKMLKHKSTHPFIEFPNEDTPTRIFFK